MTHQYSRLLAIGFIFIVLAPATLCQAQTQACREYFAKVQSAKLATRHDFEILYFVKPDGSLWWRRDDVGLGPPAEGSLDQPCRVEELVSHSLSEPRQVRHWGAFGGLRAADAFSGGKSTIYALRKGGDLDWYRHIGYQDGSDQWAATGNGTQVGTGWESFTKVIPMGHGVLYGVLPDGGLRWNKHENYVTGEGLYAGWAEAVNVANIFRGDGHDPVHEYKYVFGGGAGVFYAVNGAGELVWFKHKTWLNPVEKRGPAALEDWEGGRTVGEGWNGLSKIFSAGHGHIYALLPSGELRAYDHVGWQDGTAKWGQEVSLGKGWGDYKFIFAAMN